jgi:hypothetical protein
MTCNANNPAACRTSTSKVDLIFHRLYSNYVIFFFALEYLRYWQILYFAYKQQYETMLYIRSPYETSPRPQDSQFGR